MQKKQFDNNNFVLYAPDSLNYITGDLESILNNTFDFYKKLFDVDNFRKIQINYFDKLEDFRNFVYEIRGESESLSEYAAGTFDGGMINAYIASNVVVGSPLYYHRKYMASHELFHIMYMELIWEKNNQDRIVWFDEGMAQLFSGTYDYAFNDNFYNWFNELKNSTKVIPELNKLDHGTGFMNSDYNGYYLSVLAVKYLYDTMGIDNFKQLMSDNKKILELGNTALKDAFDYYDSLLNNNLHSLQ